MMGRTPFETTIGYTPDISEYVSFAWYQWIWFWEPTGMQSQQLGRWCDVADSVGSGHTYYILNSNGKIISRSSVTHLTSDEMTETQERRKDFNANIEGLLGDYNKSTLKNQKVDPAEPYADFIDVGKEDYSDTIEFFSAHKKEMNDGTIDAEDEKYNESISKEISDNIIGTSVLLPSGDSLLEGIVRSKKRTADGSQLIGKANFNPLLDTRIYEIEFPDGGRAEFSTNIIIESIMEHTNAMGETVGMISGIIGHRKNDSAITKELANDTFEETKQRVVTTRGWEFQVEWTDGTSSWIPLKDVKAADPLQAAEYAVANDLNKEPAFIWWVSHTLRTRNRVISRLKAAKISKGRNRFGIRVPVTIEEAESLDKINKNTFWKESMEQELKKVRIAFKLHDDIEDIPVASKKINYHFIFDVKMDLTRKARLVAGGHLNRDVPKYASYSSVVSRESIRICFTLAALNDQEIISGDIGNAYLNAKPLETCHVEIKDNYLFGPSAMGKSASIVRALYGMKTSGNAWHQHLANILEHDLGFKQCYADNDVWMKPAHNSKNEKVYDYICIYVDDILAISTTPDKYMTALNAKVKLKRGSVGTPTSYLGTDIKKKEGSDNEKGYWILGSNSYLKESLRIVKTITDESGVKIRGKGSQPYSSLSYRPELDITPFCDPDKHNLFQVLIGMLRWLIELGRVDVLLETSQLSSYLASPRVGHLMQALHIFHYLSRHDSSWMPMDPNKLDIEFKGPQEASPEVRRTVMRKIYQDACEEIPDNQPTPRGKSVQVNLYVDADHAGNTVTRRSQTGILIFINMALIYWDSRKQNTVESSTFGSEYIALKAAIEKVIGLRYKLRMMGVSIDGPASIFCDNESVVKSAVNPDATLKKKNISIAYHKCRESFAAGVANIYFVFSEENLADLLTKVLSVVKRKNIFDCIYI